jgi:hypothetical protein
MEVGHWHSLIKLCWFKISGETNATFTVTVQYKGEQRTTALPLTLAMIGQLALEASQRDLSIGEFAGDIVVEVLKNGILEQVLGSDRGAATEQF